MIAPCFDNQLSTCACGTEPEETPTTLLRAHDPGALWVSYGFRAPATADASGLWESYAYVFTKRHHLNVGVGYRLPAYRAAARTQAYDVYRAFVEFARARGVLDGEPHRQHFTPFLIPMDGPMRRAATGRVIVAGDAAGFVHAATAEGIYYAMVSGELAAKAVIATDPRTIRGLAPRYGRAVDDEIGAELRDSVLIQRYLFADRRRIARVVAGARHAADLTGLILDFAVGGMTYKALRRRMFAQAHSRSLSALLSFKTQTPFDHLPVWKEIRTLPLAEQMRRYRDPELRKTLVAMSGEQDGRRPLGTEAKLPDYDWLLVFDTVYGPHRTVADVARERKQHPAEANGSMDGTGTRVYIWQFVEFVRREAQCGTPGAKQG